MVDHIDEADRLSKWKEAKVVRRGMNKKKRKVLETLFISTNRNIKKRTDDIVWAAPAARMCLHRIRRRWHSAWPS